MRLAGRSLAVLILGTIALPTDAHSRTWYVNPDGTGDATHIQAAVDLAAAGDTVLVAAGTYRRGDVYLRGEDLVVRSESGPEQTIIEGAGYPWSGGGLRFWNDETPAFVLEGFTFARLSPNPFAGAGGAISCIGASPTIRDCIFMDNIAISTPGEPGPTFGAGAAIGCVGVASPTIAGCIFLRNQSYGGIVWCGNGSTPTITNCTFADNWSGIGAYDGSYVAVENTIIAFSTQGPATQGAGLFSCTDIFGNAGGDWPEPSQAGVNGNFSADPRFCNRPAGDISLAADSPCLAAPGCGRVGAVGQGCAATTSVEAPHPVRTTWGGLKRETIER